jgi:hypothetical protein
MENNNHHVPKSPGVTTVPQNFKFNTIPQTQMVSSSTAQPLFILNTSELPQNVSNVQNMLSVTDTSIRAALKESKPSVSPQNLHRHGGFNEQVNFVKTEIKTSLANHINETNRHNVEALVVNTFGGSSVGQASPMNASASRFPITDNVGDAMLSAINYSVNDSEMLPDGSFTIRVPSNMSNLSVDDNILTTMTSGGMTNPSGGTFDLFNEDSSMQEYNMESLSPHTAFGDNRPPSLSSLHLPDQDSTGECNIITLNVSQIILKISVINYGLLHYNNVMYVHIVTFFLKYYLLF